MAAGDSDMKKVGNTFLQVKLVLNKGVGTEDVFMGKCVLCTFPKCKDGLYTGTTWNVIIMGTHEIETA